MSKPTHPGYWWYRDRHNELWCIKVFMDNYPADHLEGWVPGMDYTDPIDLTPNWDGTWLGEAIPPEVK